MKCQKFLHKSICLMMLGLGLLTACQSQTLPAPIGSSPMPISSTTSYPTTVPSPSLTQDIPSLLPAVCYQLTFVSECSEGTQSMYAVDISCLESDQPCIGEPQLLFEVSKRSHGPRPPIFPYDWSPNGGQVVMAAVGFKGKDDIFVGDWDGRNWVNLTNSPDYESNPTWVPDGSRITYIASSGEPDNSFHAYTMTLDGKKASQLLSTLTLSGVGVLYWAPDGRQVVFAYSDVKGYYQLFLANPDGSDLRQLTYEEENHGLYGFSPDGQWILYTLETETGASFNNIYRIQIDGLDKVAVTQSTKGIKSNLAWAPGGDWIAFTSKMEGNYDVYLIRVDGTGLTKITHSNADEFAPAWRTLSP